MARKVYLANYLSSEELKKKYFSSKDKVESRRWHLPWKISRGWNIKNSALAVEISYFYAKQIVKKYNNQGEKAILNGHKTRKKHNVGKNRKKLES